jgi:hypothetical protein
VWSWALTDANVSDFTVTAAHPDSPPHVAEIVTSPTAMPVSRPVLLTVATEASPDDQVMVRPLSTFPRTSFGMAVN